MSTHDDLLESIGIPNKPQPRGRPKGSKSKKTSKNKKKRSLQEQQANDPPPPPPLYINKLHSYFPYVIYSVILLIYL